VAFKDLTQKLLSLANYKVISFYLIYLIYYNFTAFGKLHALVPMVTSAKDGM
jgi:hypothetical protein